MIYRLFEERALVFQMALGRLPNYTLTPSLGERLPRRSRERSLGTNSRQQNNAAPQRLVKAQFSQKHTPPSPWERAFS